jgi:hypothetical protein
MMECISLFIYVQFGQFVEVFVKKVIYMKKYIEDVYVCVVWTMTYISHLILLRTYLSYDINKEIKIKIK